MTCCGFGTPQFGVSKGGGGGEGEKERGREEEKGKGEGKWDKGKGKEGESEDEVEQRHLPRPPRSTPNRPIVNRHGWVGGPNFFVQILCMKSKKVPTPLSW